MGMRPIVVRQGDYLTQLAFRHGFNAEEVWNAGENSELRQHRANPEMLAPGDVLHIPDTPEDGPSLQIGSTNKYVAHVPKVRVVVELGDEDRVLPNEPYRVEGLGAPIAGRSNAEGHVELNVPVTTREVLIVLPEHDAIIPVFVGDLDPINALSGVRQRLRHLGYYELGSEAVEPEADTSAIRRFQRDRQLPVTGELDDRTRDALRDAHRS